MAASALTFLQVINRVLERLRESSVAAFNSTDYSTHLGHIVNQVKAELEEAWYWHAMRETYSVSTSNNTSNYALTSSGMNAVVIDGWNTTTGDELGKGSVADFNAKFFGTGSSSVQTGSPRQYIPAGFDANFDLTVDVWPIPVTGNLDTLKFSVFVPQADLAASATVPLVPQNVLIEETIARALVERGDENAPKPAPGETFILRDLLASAIARDEGRTDPTESDWEVV